MNNKKKKKLYINNSEIIETVMRRSDKVHPVHSGINRAESATPPKKHPSVYYGTFLIR